eukprot:scaffold186230_cov35-Tisochrysis_lutea.AAC.1
MSAYGHLAGKGFASMHANLMECGVCVSTRRTMLFRACHRLRERRESLSKLVVEMQPQSTKSKSRVPEKWQVNPTSRRRLAGDVAIAEAA